VGEIYPELTNMPLVFRRGMVSNGDETVIPRDAPSSLTNCVLTDKGYPTQCLGNQRYNPTSMGTAKTSGGIGFLGYDGNNYMIVASNGYLWWSNGNGTMTKVKYKADSSDVTIDTTDYFYNFLVFPQNIGGTVQNVVFCVAPIYPIATNSNGTHAQNSTTSRALMFYVSSGVVYAKNVFYDTSVALDTMYATSNGTWTAGTQTPTVAGDSTAGHAPTLSGGVEMTVAVGTAAGLNDMYKAESFNGTDKTVNVQLFPDTIANMDYVYLQLGDTGSHWSRWIFSSVNLAAGALNQLTFDLTSTPTATSGTLDITAITKVTLGVHTTNNQALNYTFSQLINSASGSDDQVVGHQSNTPPDQSWPKEGTSICRVFDKILITVGNSYYVSQSKNALNWTNASGAIDVGGGTVGEPYTASLSYGTSVLLFTRTTLTNINATPGDLSTWREVPVETKYGNVGNSVCKNNDGLVYYMSPNGIARTDGRMAELCDYDIQDETSFLTQLIKGYFVSSLNQATDWKNGTSIGSNQVDVSGTELKQTYWNTQAQWLACTSGGNLDTTTYPNAVAISSGGALPTTNIALNATAYEFGYWIAPLAPLSPQNGDNQLGQWWASSMIGGSGGPWWAVDLGAVYSLYSINFFIEWVKISGPGVQSPNPSLQYSLDNINWTTLGTILATGAIHFIAGANFPTPISAQYLRILWPTLTEPDLYVVRLQGFSVFTAYPATGTTFVTPTIDYNSVPATYGNITMNINVPKGCSAVLSLLTSSNGGSWSSPSVITSVPPGTQGNFTFALPSPTTEYIRIQATLLPDPTFLTTPIIYFMAVGGVWVSGKVNLGTTPTQWGVFDAVQDNTGVTYEIRSSSNGTSWGSWTQILSGKIPTVTLYPYIEYRVSLNGTNYQLMPDVQSISLAYLTGSTTTNLPSVYCWHDKIYVSYMQNNSTLGANDSCYVGETHLQTPLDWQTSSVSGAVYPMWSKRDFIQANSFFDFGDDLMSAGSVAGNVNYMEVSRTNCAYIVDEFGRPDSVITMGNATTGQTWTYGDIGGAGDSDIFGISGQMAYCANANVANHPRYALLPASADCSVVCTLPVLNPNQGLILRYIDDNNYLALFVGSSTVSPTQHEYYFRKVISGVVTGSPSMPSAGSVGIADEGDEVQVKMVGTSLTIFVNGEQLYQATVANTTGTSHGLYLAGTGYISSRWYYFSINYPSVSKINYSSEIITCALFSEDRDILLRLFYAYYSCVSAFTIQYRYRINQDNWGDWSDPIKLIPSPNICRSIKQVISGIVNAMAVQFKITQPDSDGDWGVPKINVWVEEKQVGR
jgi:hypothetical protein